MAILQKAAERSDKVPREPGVGVAFVGMGASSVDFTVFAWGNAADYLGVLHNVRRSVYEDLNAAGIDIPYNQLVLHRAGAPEVERMSA